jgi:hypothetical protein
MVKYENVKNDLYWDCFNRFEAKNSCLWKKIIKFSFNCVVFYKNNLNSP